MGHIARVEPVVEIEGLRQCYVDLGAAEDKRDGIKARIAEAQVVVVGGQAKRAALVALIAAGGQAKPGAVLAIENVTREAESSLLIYREALAAAEAEVSSLEKLADEIEAEAWRADMTVFSDAARAAEAELKKAAAAHEEAQQLADRQWRIGRKNHPEFQARVRAHWPE